ncbi:MAG: ABC transporter permease [Acidobacteriaceae bacterium]|nr:ABC transporter permease [Acidobacteriaceae bacterium]
MSDLWKDVRYGVRQLIKYLGFTAVAVITLALGIGANTALFSVVYNVLLQPLPFKNSGRIVEILSESAKWGGRLMQVPAGDLGDIVKQSHSFENAALYSHSFPLTLTGSGDAEALNDVQVTTNFFGLLGVSPEIGRTFTVEEGTPGKDQVVVMSDSLWRRHFGANPGVLGKSLRLDKKAFTVVGVMPANFWFPAKTTDIWIPRAITAEDASNRGIRNATIVAVLRDGTKLPQAQAELKAIGKRLAASYPDEREWALRALSLRERLSGKVESALLVLMGAVSFVLLIACANVANLLLVRGTSQRSELATRRALGASNRHILQQLIVENLILAAAGGALGLAATSAALRVFWRFAPAEIPRLHSTSLTIEVFCFAAAISILSSFVFGVIPAVHVFRHNLHSSLNQRASTPSPRLGRSSAWSILVVSEVALALILLAGAGLMLHSFWVLTNVNPGLNPHNTLNVWLSRPISEFRTPQKTRMFFQQVLEEIGKKPGVESAALSNMSVLAGSEMQTSISRVGPGAASSAREGEAQIQVVSPNYFRTLGVPMLKGRDFSDRDRAGSKPAVIINEAMAGTLFRNEEPVGKELKLGWAGLEGDSRVIGVVGNTRDVALQSPAEPEVYATYLQARTLGLGLIVRTTSDPLSLVPVIRRNVAAIDKNQPLGRITTLEEALSLSVEAPRFRTLLLASFAGLALILAVIGVYGVMSYSVRRRVQEIGIRMSLGASPQEVLKMVLKQAAGLAFVGIVIGLSGSMLLIRSLMGMLYGIRVMDPITLIPTPIILLVLVILSSYIPARRAMRVDPAVALRNQ